MAERWQNEVISMIGRLRNWFAPETRAGLRATPTYYLHSAACDGKRILADVRASGGLSELPQFDRRRGARG